jgi:hypothetical protein
MDTYRKKPVDVAALRWTGDNDAELTRFTGSLFNTLPTEGQVYDPEFTAEVFDKLHSRWIPLRTGDWILRGVRGEFYPCEESVFAETYEQVS